MSKIDSQRKDEIKHYYQLGKKLSQMIGRDLTVQEISDFFADNAVQVKSLIETGEPVSVQEKLPDYERFAYKKCYEGMSLSTRMFLLHDTAKQHSSPTYDRIRSAMDFAYHQGKLKSEDEEVKDQVEAFEKNYRKANKGHVNLTDMKADMAALEEIIRFVYKDITSRSKQAA